MKIKNNSSVDLKVLDSEPKVGESFSKGFYLQSDIDTIPMLFNNEGYITISSQSNNYYFLRAKYMKYFSIQDSLKFKEHLTHYKLKYNGEKINTLHIDEKTNYKKT